MEAGSFDELGDRMKAYEAASETRLLKGVPFVARLDGKAFHTYTRGMARPYDARLQVCMTQTAISLLHYQPLVAYTQSDEITLVFREPLLFDGRVQKLCSILAGSCSSRFALEAHQHLPEKRGASPVFDCRVFSVPNLEEALEVLAWREADAVKNSVAMAAQAHFSHKKLEGKGRKDMLDMLHGAGVNWNDFPPHFKRGVYFRKGKVERTLTTTERARIPEKHRPPEGEKVVRQVVRMIAEAPLRRLPDPMKTMFGDLEPLKETP